MILQDVIKEILRIFNWYLGYIESDTQIANNQSAILLENVVKDILNIIYDANYENLNKIKKNHKAIDLLEKNKKIMIQISVSCKKDKIQKSLQKFDEKKDLKDQFAGYEYIFFCGNKTSKQLSYLKKEKYKIPEFIKFIPEKNIWSFNDLCDNWNQIESKKARKVLNYLKENVWNPGEVEFEKLHSDLVAVSEELSQNNLQKLKKKKFRKKQEFEIEEKINYNKLESLKQVFDKYKIYFSIYQKILDQFSENGKETAFNISQIINDKYLEISKTEKQNEKIFEKIFSFFYEFIKNHSNKSWTQERLEICLKIIITYYFIQCEIFERPQKNVNAKRN
ncbi:ABC-three component system protein [Mycoplasmopsis synoviae]|uniref:ABC-three component system protein n=1 Tax=Mycoplasmopsis synoviae TaxID=2109 RepID=UPI001CE1864B|nr:ABC-three component system protein [Mycoplasmopsis synoviae]UBX98669.1 SMEK domain-containing protein [Mycoplasmopsis synoviae]